MDSIILDIRSRTEYAKGHICGSYNIETPQPPLSNEQINNLYNQLSNLNITKDTSIQVYCKKGIRSAIATNMLRNIGYRNVEDLGGITKNPLKMVYEKKHCICRHQNTYRN